MGLGFFWTKCVRIPVTGLRAFLSDYCFSSKMSRPLKCCGVQCFTEPKVSEKKKIAEKIKEKEKLQKKKQEELKKRVTPSFFRVS